MPMNTLCPYPPTRFLHLVKSEVSAPALYVGRFKAMWLFLSIGGPFPGRSHNKSPIFGACIKGPRLGNSHMRTSKCNKGHAARV